MDDEDLALLHQILRAKKPDEVIAVSHYFCHASEMLEVIEQAQAYRKLNEGKPREP